jgi:cytochrome c oxidase cbb3-type subunit 2
MAFKALNHGTLERNVGLLGLLALLTVTIGGIVEIAPLFWIDSTIEKVKGVRPYTPLELAGRNIYIREGCYVCHSQMKWNAMAITVWRPSRCTTTRSNGGPSAPGRIWHGSAGAIRMNGTASI